MSSANPHYTANTSKTPMTSSTTHTSTRRSRFEEQLRALQNDISHLSEKLVTPNTNTAVNTPGNDSSSNSNSDPLVNGSSSSSGSVGRSNAGKSTSAVMNSSFTSHGATQASIDNHLSNQLQHSQMIGKSSLVSKLRDEIQYLKRERDDALFRLSQAELEIGNLWTANKETGKLKVMLDHLQQEFDALRISFESSERIRKQQKDLIHLLQRSSAAIDHSNMNISMSSNVSVSSIASGSGSVTSDRVVPASEHRYFIATPTGTDLINQSISSDASGRNRDNSYFQTVSAVQQAQTSHASSGNDDRSSLRASTPPVAQRNVKQTKRRSSSKSNSVTKLRSSSSNPESGSFISDSFGNNSYSHTSLNDSQGNVSQQPALVHNGDLLFGTGVPYQPMYAPQGVGVNGGDYRQQTYPMTQQLPPHGVVRRPVVAPSRSMTNSPTHTPSSHSRRRLESSTSSKKSVSGRHSPSVSNRHPTSNTTVHYYSAQTQQQQQPIYRGSVGSSIYIDGPAAPVMAPGSTGKPPRHPSSGFTNYQPVLRSTSAPPGGRRS